MFQHITGNWRSQSAICLKNEEFLPGNQKNICIAFIKDDNGKRELQIHNLGESKKISSAIDLITISRDLPFAQNRFAKESKLKKMRFVSDYKTGAFGKQSGLMIKGKELLSRSILVLDEQGIIRYLQIVPELSHLPDISQAVTEANRLAGKQ